MEDILDRLLRKTGQTRFTWGDIIKTQRENIYEIIYSDKARLSNCAQRAFIAGDLDGSKTLDMSELGLVFQVLS